MYKTLLIIHLIGSLFFLLAFIQSLINSQKNSLKHVKSAAINMVLTTAFQVISGLSLALVNFQNTSLVNFCTKLSIYLFISISAEIILYRKIRNIKFFDKLSGN